MEFAWNTQKNKINDIKGKELEQEREGKISNKDIDLKQTYKNYDLVDNDLNLYQRVKKRIDEVRSVSRVQRNSVVSYSNVVTVSNETYVQWGQEKSKEYLKEVYNYFCNEFGKENVVSAKVHLDETTPHMHLHFIPISAEGKLQARKVVTPSRINKIHSEAPGYLRTKGFDVVRGKGITHKDNIKDIHKYKFEKLKEEVDILEKRKLALTKNIKDILSVESNRDIDIKEKKGIIRSSKVEMDAKDYEYITDTLESLRGRIITLEKENFDLRENNDFYKKRENKIFSIKEKNLELESIYDLKKKSLDFREKKIELNEKKTKDFLKDLEKKENNIESIIRKVKKDNEIILEQTESNYKETLRKKDINIKQLNETLKNKNYEIEILNSENDFKDSKIKFLNLKNKINNKIIKSYSNIDSQNLLNRIKLANSIDIDYKDSYLEIQLNSKDIDENLRKKSVYKFEDAEELLNCQIEISHLKKSDEPINVKYKLYNRKSELVYIDELELKGRQIDLKNIINNQVEKFNDLLIKNRNVPTKDREYKHSRGLEL